MDKEARLEEHIMYAFFLCFALLMMGISFFVGPVNDLLPGLMRIMTSSQVLTVDAFAVGGLAPALFHCGLLGLITLILMKLSNNRASGATFGAFFLTVGFSFFGKNCLNVWPIILGTWLFSRIKKESFGKYVNLSFFACSLAPFVSEALFNRYIDYSLGYGVFLGLFVGVLIGFLFPLLTAHVLVTHKGHNLFNAGVAAGFLAFPLFCIYKTLFLKPLGLEEKYALNRILSPGYRVFLSILLGSIFAISIIVGFLLAGKSFKGYKRLLRRSGYCSDFFLLDGMGNTMINFGLLGFTCLAFFLLAGAPFTGPTIGAFLCILCWAGNGSHPRNVLPIMLGYYLVSIIASWNLSTQAVAVSFCFATGLSPLGGRWGLGWGVAAGALHSCLALYTPAIYGGFNIYNGGFAGGLVALIMVPFLESFFKVKNDSRDILKG